MNKNIENLKKYKFIDRYKSKTEEERSENMAKFLINYINHQIEKDESNYNDK
jgi:hypothetical protein